MIAAIPQYDHNLPMLRSLAISVANDDAGMFNHP